jgi:hypothetical protein
MIPLFLFSNPLLNPRAWQLVCVVWVLMLPAVFAFSPSLPVRQQQRRPVISALHETLRFKGTCEYVSEEFPLDQKQSLMDFLGQQENALILFNLGGNREAWYEPLSPNVLELWNNACNGNYGESARPLPSDCAVACNLVTSFPGLIMKNRVLNGMKVVVDQDGIPTVNAYLIGECQTVEGPAALKWLYSQLTGLDKRPKDTYSKPQSTSAYSTFSICDSGDGVAVRFAVDVEVKVDFPNFLVKVLPSSKEKMEAQGSSAIVTPVKKDAKAAVDAFAEAFKKSYLELTLQN